ncbi:MAG: hypothetical protein E3J29_02915 [Dehalococcoidia bacterium]|nr:MAG: hypothetical protein E3J29_02915 [Dehalococcoidia bacterium]
MADYPDWTRLFHLVGTEITIPVNIEASDVTIPVSIVASTATVNIHVASVGFYIPIAIYATEVTLDVNIESQTANIDFNFADQAVAVFDAAKWFAHQAQQVIVSGSASCAVNTAVVVVSRTVPSGKTFFIVGAGHSVWSITAAPTSMRCEVIIGGTSTITLGSHRGGGLAFDTPLRATTGQVVELRLVQFGSGATLVCGASFWGYDEEN